MQYILLSITLWFSFVGFTSANETLIKASVLDEQNNPIKNATIHFNGNELKSSANGYFEFVAPKNKQTTLKISKNNYYDRVHTFNHTELHDIKEKRLPFVLVAKKNKRIMLAFGGDTMMARRYYKPHFDHPVLIKDESQLEDSKAILSHVKPYLEIADLAIVNLESQIAHNEPKERAKKFVTFYSKPKMVEALKWAGIDYVTLGNNHTYDYLDEGLNSTLLALNKANLPFSGAGLTEEDALAPYLTEINHSNFAMLGYVGWQGSSKIKQTANASQGGAAFGSMENIVNSVKSAADSNHFPIVQYHGSLEYTSEPTGVTEQRLKSAIDNGAVLAIAHHPHVTQGIELYNNRLIAYSMGNFVFDQYFSSTQQSYLLYVWLDNDKLHRAEIVPLYIKGYRPTPAVGNERNSILKRVSALSAKRNTLVENFLGHGVIQPQSNNQPGETLLSLDISKDSVHALTTDWQKTIHQVKTPNEQIQYRLGSNLINGSSFDSFDWFSTEDLGFSFDKDNTSLTSPGYKSPHALSLKVKNQTMFGMKYFRRVYKASNPVTFKTHLKAKENITVNVYWQGRKSRQKLFDAFENSPKHLISSLKLMSKDEWQKIEVDFNSPRIGYRSYRVLIEVEAKDSHVLLDNFSLIEWQSAFQIGEIPNDFNNETRIATHIGFNQTSNTPVEIAFK
ncbi:CapA family protein [Thalassotalea sp. 1_MG-2023]|uniref:CapA family protein n=1 Tax=Thalassotalea sp. 1_MG-2023 TaxID=3062680 RepID=UPI0026E3FF1B|nr:CapA family protein [Thalassotalea sp. 1_MG-2023]MDO6428672.1 CapA family protein [Thalassotalea sp. 1_MG-2023]